MAAIYYVIITLAADGGIKIIWLRYSGALICTWVEVWDYFNKHKKLMPLLLFKIVKKQPFGEINEDLLNLALLLQ